jgi:hypothetical protein
MRIATQLVLPFALVLLAVFPPRALAGDPFLLGADCQQLSLDPPRYRLEFSLGNTHGFGPLCGVRILPYAFGVTAAQPALECSGPAPFTASVDSLTGTAEFSRAPCDSNWFFVQHFYVVVATVPVYFTAELLTTGGAVRHTNTLSYLCTSVVPVAKRSWGAVKLRYR